MQPRLDKNVVAAGAILHDIGKLREYEHQSQGAVYTAEGALIGHMLQGRDIVREAAADRKLATETMLRLEHVIISHQGRPEWGAAKIPMTPEAMIVHYADDLDAKYAMMYTTLRDDKNPGPMTSKKNQLFQQVFRGIIVNRCHKVNADSNCLNRGRISAGCKSRANKDLLTISPLLGDGPG